MCVSGFKENDWTVENFIHWRQTADCQASSLDMRQEHTNLMKRWVLFLSNLKRGSKTLQQNKFIHIAKPNNYANVYLMFISFTLMHLAVFLQIPTAAVLWVPTLAECDQK